MSAARAMATADLVSAARELHGRADAWRAACVGLWRVGDLSYLLHEGQQQCLLRIGDAASTRRFVINVGRRWGKSRLMVVIANWLIVLRILYRRGVSEAALRAVAPGWLVDAALRTKRPARVVYAAPTAGMVAEFIEPHMRLLCDHAPPELRPAYNSISGTWIWPSGDKLVVRGCEDRKKADRLRGAEADMGIVDEGGFIPCLDYVVRSVVGPQLWETRGRMLLPSTPPESPDHPFVELVQEAEAAGAYYHATTASAPHMTPQMLAAAIEDAGGEHTVAWQREGEARIIVDPQQVVVPEWEGASPVVVAEHERPEHFLPHVVGDLGYVDMTVIAFGYYDFKHGLDVVERELVLRHTTSAKIDAEVAAIEAELWPGLEVHRRHIDAQPITRADMARGGFGADREVGEDGEDGEFWQPVRKDEREAAINAMRLRVGRRQLRVDPRCTTIIAHARYGRWNARRTDFERPDGGEHHYDGLAALVYFTRMLDRQTNPFPERELTTIDKFRKHRVERSEQDKLRGLFRRGA